MFGLRRLIAILMMSGVATAATAGSDTRLSVAAMNGDVPAVESLLNKKVDVNEAQGDGSTALHWAAYRDDATLANRLLQAGARTDVKTRLGDITPLYMAAKNGSVPIIEALLKAGARVDALTTTGSTPLMMAAMSGNAAAVKILLDHGADPNAKDLNQGQTALMFAAALDRADVIGVLAARGANLNLTSLVPTPYEAKKAGEEDKLAAGKGNGKPDKGPLALGGMTALQFAARDGHMTAAKVLIEAGADVNVATASDKMTTLTVAVLNGHFDLAKYLLDHGADPKPANSAGITALFALIDAQWAAKVWYPAPSVDQETTNYLDLMKELLVKGADPNVRIKQKLWQRQFHPDWVDPSGATPFWRAAQANDVAALRLLATFGANPAIATTHGCSPLQVATGFGFEPQISTFIPGGRLPTVRFLVDELGADVNSRDDKGYTPLHGAGLTADNDVILYLIAHGADVKARANQVFASGDGPGEDVSAGSGDTVADMANGPRPHNLVFPETVALLEKLGSPNSDNCRASTCLIKGKSDKTKKQ